ncbi:MAG TPA: hypothetical protein VGG95_11810 [Edaphobacter sp.]
MGQNPLEGMRVPLGITFLATALLLGSAQSVREMPPLAAERLTNIQLFALGGIGFAGKTSDGETAFKVVMGEPRQEALQTLEKVFANGSVAAKSYALVGIRALAPERFDTLYQTVSHSQKKVQTMSGCIASTRPLREIADEIRSGAYDRKLPPNSRENSQPSQR